MTKGHALHLHALVRTMSLPVAERDLFSICDLCERRRRPRELKNGSGRW